MEEKTIQSIFIVDDDSVSRKKLVRIFQRLGFEQIREAEQGDEALTLLKEQPADLVMADWHMPGLSGLDLLKAIRAEETLQNSFVYLVTVEARQAQIVAAVQAGATGYIMKPFSQESIIQKLDKLLPADLQPVESHGTQESEQPENQPHQETPATTVG